MKAEQNSTRPVLLLNDERQNKTGHVQSFYWMMKGRTKKTRPVLLFGWWKTEQNRTRKSNYNTTKCILYQNIFSLIFISHLKYVDHIYILKYFKCLAKQKSVKEHKHEAINIHWKGDIGFRFYSLFQASSEALRTGNEQNNKWKYVLKLNDSFYF